MDVGLHERAEGGIDALVALDQWQAGERRGDNAHPEVATAVACTGMASVKVAFILDQQLLRRQHAFECGPDKVDTGAHGSTFLNGRTTTSRYTPAAR